MYSFHQPVGLVSKITESVKRIEVALIYLFMKLALRSFLSSFLFLCHIQFHAKRRPLCKTTGNISASSFRDPRTPRNYILHPFTCAFIPLLTQSIPPQPESCHMTTPYQFTPLPLITCPTKRNLSNVSTITHHGILDHHRSGLISFHEQF